MMQNNLANQHAHAKNKGNNLLFPLFISVVIGMTSMILAVVLFSVIWSKTDIPAALSIFSYGAVVFGALVTGLLTALAFRQEKLMLCAISGVGFAILLVLFNLIFFRAPITSSGLIKYALALFVPIGASFLVRTDKKRRHKHN